MTVGTDTTGSPGSGDAAGAPMVLSALEFDVVWEHLRLPPMPVVIGVPSPGRTHAERAELVEQAWRGVEARGLGRRVGLHPPLLQLLRVLARPDVELDARIWLTAETRSLTASGDGCGVHVVSDGSTLTLREIEPEGLPTVAIGGLPERSAGRGHSVTLPSVDFETAAAEEVTQEGFADGLTRRGVREDDAAMLSSMISEVVGQGQFGAAARDAGGRRHRAARVVSFFDVADGRYVQIRRASDDGRPWTTIAPVDRRRLLQHVDELLADVRRAAGRR